MTDDGAWVLAEPYATQLQEVKNAATKAWHAALISELAPMCPRYTAQELSDELQHRNNTRSDGKVPLLDEFIVEALTGDL